MLEYQIQEELVDGLCRIFSNSISQIILYGSVARKEAAPESDVDIAIILDGEMEDGVREQFSSFAAGLDLKYERVFSIIDIERKNLEKWGNILPFYQNIRKEGVVLWKAAWRICQDTVWRGKGDAGSELLGSNLVPKWFQFEVKSRGFWNHYEK